MYVSALGQGVLVINSQRVAVDLLEKRSNIYSDRQYFISAGEFATRNLHLSMTPYGDLYVVDSLNFTYADLVFKDGAASVVSSWKVSPNQLYIASIPSRVAKLSC